MSWLSTVLKHHEQGKKKAFYLEILYQKNKEFPGALQF